MLADGKKVAAKPLVAIPYAVTLAEDSLLRLFYRGRLGSPWTEAHRLLKKKDVAYRDRRIGAGPTAP